MRAMVLRTFSAMFIVVSVAHRLNDDDANSVESSASCEQIAGEYHVDEDHQTTIIISQNGCELHINDTSASTSVIVELDGNVMYHEKEILGIVLPTGSLSLEGNRTAVPVQPPALQETFSEVLKIEESGEKVAGASHKEGEHVSMNSTGASFCWKDSYGRGIGRSPQSCAANQEMKGLLCYENCPEGFERTWASGFGCITKCPNGWADSAWHCRNSEYGRGAGYAFWHEQRCKDQNPDGCEWWGAMVYPKCKENFTNFGCCICRPDEFKCEEYGDFDHKFDLSCAKKIRGLYQPYTGQCTSDEEKQAGLCYKKCEPGYDGVGPVCWGRPPPDWVSCGMGAADNSLTCGSQVFDQVLAPFEIVAAIATAGASSAVFKTAKAAKTTVSLGAKTASAGSKTAKLVNRISDTQSFISDTHNLFKETKGIMTGQVADIAKIGERLYEGSKKTGNLGEDAKKAIESSAKVRNATTEAGQLLNVLISDSTPEELVSQAAALLSVVDPTGIASVVSAYSHPKCSEL